MRVLVCGGRNFGMSTRGEITDQADLLFDALQDLLEHCPELIVIEGGARGADSLARIWAAHKNVTCITTPAEWRKHGTKAGPIRNQQMIDEGCPDLVLAAPGGVGTRDMIRRAQKQGIKVQCLA